MVSKCNILYIGGFELPDKNAAAQRVIGNAKALREIGCSVSFLNSLKECSHTTTVLKQYFGFDCYEYKRESQFSYLLSGKKVIDIIKKTNSSIVIAYNYPAIALKHIYKYCKTNNIRCYADVTEWYQVMGNPIFKVIKNYDTNLRMKKIQKKLDGIIAISKYLYDYYKPYVKNTVLIPPLIDISDEKWNAGEKNSSQITSFVYAGSPSSSKEQLNLICEAINAVSQKYNVVLNIVGITKEQYRSIYNISHDNFKHINFVGRVSHNAAIKFVKDSSWSIIIRNDDKLVVNAGFPTKLVESIACGTPVIANNFSNVCDYLNDTNSIIVVDKADIMSAIEHACSKKLSPDAALFDYHNYINEFSQLLK